MESTYSIHNETLHNNYYTIKRLNVALLSCSIIMYVDTYKYVGTVVSVMYISTYSTSAFKTYIMHRNLVGLRMHRKHLVTNSTLQSSSHNHYNNIM